MSAPLPASTALPRSVRAGYGIGSIATGSFSTVPGLLLLPYLTDRLGVSAALAGLIVFLPKAWDVVLNPIAGRISDRSTNPAGRRRPFLLRAGLALAVLFVVLFAGPTTPQGVAAAWVVIAFLGCATAYAFFQVPYIAMPAEITDDYRERTRLMSWRVAVLALAILLSGGLSPAIRDALGATWGYRGVGLFVGALITIGAVGVWRGTASAPTTSAPSPTAGLGEQLRIVARAREFRLLLITFVIQAVAIGAMLAGVDYAAKWVVGTTGAATVLFVAFVGPALLVTPLWERFGARVGKKTGYVYASAVLCIGAVLAYAARTVSLPVLAVAVAVIGVGFAGAQLFPLAMLPDAAAVDAARTGENRVGVYTGVWTGGETLGLATGPGLYAVILAIGGYVSSSAGDVTQTTGAVQAISLGFTLVPAALILVSLVVLARYRLGEAEVRAARDYAMGSAQ